MFIILLNYKKPIEVVDQFIVVHREFLSEHYQKNHLIVSGPQNPRTGGVLISQLKDREELMNIIKQDPFYINEIADYEVIEFLPVKYHPDFASFVE